MFYGSNYLYTFRTKDITPFVVYTCVFKNSVDQKMGHHYPILSQLLCFNGGGGEVHTGFGGES